MDFEQDFQEDSKEIEFQPGEGNQHTLEAEWPCRFLCVQFSEEVASINLDPAPIFNEHYLPLVRRNCWLSGFHIEATAHEKAEWMQGFPREELQAWNLKM